MADGVEAPRRHRAIPLLLALAGYALALGQRPGTASSDTKIDLHVDPVAFLGKVASTWTSSGSLGHVQGGQYNGYLWPMGPFFALGHVAGLAPWLVDRLWLGTLLALTAYGTVRLMDELLGRPRGVAHLVAGALMILNPYVVVFTNRTTITLLAYAALPWLLLAVHRGVRDPRGWAWPAAFALVLTTTGGGINAAVTAWVLLAPLLLLLYEPLLGGVSWRDARAFAWRAALAGALASAWWVLPLLVQSAYGIDFLRFTEQPGTIWGTTSATESLRLMGYWPSYVAVGFSGRVIPYFDDSATMLFSLPVLAASLLVPGLALAGFAWTRRWRYGAFFVALVVVSLLIMMAGFPESTPLRRGLTFAYYRIGSLQFLRTTYKAAPLLAMGIACLGGAAAGEAWRRIATRRELAGGARRAAAAAGAVVVILLLAGQAWPLVAGRGVDRQLSWDRIPSAWRQAGAGLDRELPSNRRAVLFPGQLFAYYDWGGTVDPILPVLTDRPVAVRSIVPYADQHSIDLQWTTDALVSQRRLLPGQLRPLLGLMGVGAVVLGADDDRARSGALQANETARELDSGQGLPPPARSYGPRRRYGPEPGKPGPAVELPEVRRYDLPGRGIVRVEATRPETVVDGSASTLAGLAAFGGLPRAGVLRYAGDQSPASIRAAATAGGEVVIGDGNRRRAFVAARMSQNVGWTVGAGDPITRDAAVLDPFEAQGRGSDAQTVQVLDGARYARAPFSPGFSLYPEHLPVAAFDGDPRTAWLADRALEAPRRWVELGLRSRRDVPWIEVTPYDDARGRVEAVEVGGRAFPVHPGVNRLLVALRGVDAVQVRIAAVRAPAGHAPGVGGLAEVRVPGVRVRAALRPPVLAERALAGADLRRTGLTYLFERTTGDDPWRRATVRGPAQAYQARDAGDGETEIARRIAPPVARAYRLQAWVTAGPTVSDDALDRLAGYRGADRFDGSSRWLGLPGYRASGAFDGDRGRAWVAGWLPGRAAWLGWTTARPATVRVLHLARPAFAVAVPTRVRLRVPGGESGALAVGPGGAVRLPRALRGRRFRLEILDARSPAAYGPSRRRAVGIGEVTGAGVPRVVVPRAGALRSGCDAARVASGPSAAQGRPSTGLRVVGTVAALDAGTPLRARGCGPLTLPAGPQTVRVAPGPFLVDLLALASAAPAGPPSTLGGGRVESAGAQHRGRWTGVRVALDGPSWLVLGESFNRGWRATCDGRGLGPPVVVDGYANGWRAPAGCRVVGFDFAPNTAISAAYVVSAVAVAALLTLILVAWWRTRRRGTVGEGRGERGRGPPAVPDPRAPAALARRWPLLPDPPPPRRWPARWALLTGAAAAAVLGFMFALRAGVVFGPVLALVLWRGIGARTLTLCAGALLVVVVPALYLLEPLHDHGGLNFTYGVDRLDAHWVGVAAVLLLAAALGRTIAGARNAIHGAPADGPDPGPAPADADRPPTDPGARDPAPAAAS